MTIVIILQFAQRLEIQPIYKEYSKKISQKYKNYLFLDEFLEKVDLFFKDTYYISHAQYICTKKQIIDDGYLQVFSMQINDIVHKTLETLYLYICQSIENIAKIYQANTFVFKSISFASGETHNGKKSILIIEFNDKKIVYRPYNMSFLQNLINSFNFIKLDLDYDVKLFPKILHFNKEFSIIEFIKTENIKNRLSFYYSIGVAMAFAYCFRITDLVGDNVIFTSNSLCIVDSEVCFYRSNYKKEFNLFDIKLFSDNNDLNCGLIDAATKEFGIEIVENKKVNFIKTRNNQKQKLHIKNYQQFVLKGFGDCFLSILYNQANILKIIKENSFEVRHLLRPTNAYANWLIEMFMPQNNIKNNLSNLYVIMNKYRLGDIDDSNSEIIVKEELIDLLMTDIPYFYFKSNTTYLWHKNKKIVNNFYKNDLISFFTNYFQNINKDTLNTELNNFKKLLEVAL